MTKVLLYLTIKQKKWLTPSQGTSILSIWSFCTNLWWILVQKHPSVLGTKPPFIGETPHIPVGEVTNLKRQGTIFGVVSATQNSVELPFYFMWGRRIVCPKWILLTLKLALFWSKMQIITAYYCKEVQITSWTCTILISKASTKCHIRCRPPLPMVGICQNSAEIAARPKELVSNFTSSQKQVNKTCSWRPPK